ncbi:MAG: hypothetical protein P4L43_18735 [Syntrophobacteraceae bacterium]|nr:hypothetical protein [Syntrophobacteraceae bacterium]
MTEEKKYWFPAKRYGWGWGLPCSWQGWVVFAAYFGLLALAISQLRPGHPFHFLFLVAVLTVLLLAVCRLKGEPPGWRWGKH